MRNYKKEYQNRIKNKKEIRGFVDNDSYVLFSNILKANNLSISKWLQNRVNDYIYTYTLDYNVEKVNRKV